MKKILLSILVVYATLSAKDLGNLSKNPFSPNSTSNKFGAGNPYNPNSINNPYGTYGSKYSNKSANNPYATNVPKLYDSNGNYRGKLSKNRFDIESLRQIWKQIFA